MGPVARPVRLAAALVIPIAAFIAAFAAGRATVNHRLTPDPVRTQGGVPVGILDTRAGALAAADNYVAAGVTASVDQHRVGVFADTLMVPSARAGFLSASDRLAQSSGPPPGSSVLGVVVAHALRSYTASTAQVTTWEAGSYWGPDVPPTQYWALADLALRWSGGRWQIVSLRERVPGPVPALVSARAGARTSEAWNVALAGMSAPYYGAGGDGTRLRSSWRTVSGLQPHAPARRARPADGGVRGRGLPRR